MAKADATVEELVGMIQRGELRLPEMQRRFVWRATRVRDLLDSLYRGYPSGAILVWETDTDVPLQEFAVEQQANPYHASRLLLDGQQRLTSLSAVIRGERVNVRGRQRPIDILFNLDHPEQLSVVSEIVEDGDDEDEEGRTEDEGDATEDELQQRFDRMTFVVATQKLEKRRNWVRVTEVFNTDSDRTFLRHAGVSSLDDERAELYQRRLAKLRAIKKYVYRMDILERSLSYDEVTEIFVRVNSLGAKLRSSDLASAQITAKWRGALQIFEDYQTQCAQQGFDLDLGIHLKNLVSFATGQSRFQTVSRLGQDELVQAWREATEGMNFALNFLRSNAGIDAPALLASPFLLVTVGYFGHRRGYRLTQAEADNLRRWALVANAKGRYSRGSTESMLDQDLLTIKSGRGAEELLDRLRSQTGQLEFTPDELKGRNQRSALFKTMFLAFRAAGARDWRSNLQIALKHQGTEHKLQYHHVFPKEVLKGHYPARDVDDIANLAFIAGRTNRTIGVKAPAEYLHTVVADAGEAALRAQCIPTDPSCWTLEAYPEFLARRRVEIAAALNTFVHGGANP